MDDALTEQELLCEIAKHRGNALAAEALYQERLEERKEAKREEKRIERDLRGTQPNLELGRKIERTVLGPASKARLEA